MVGANGRRRVLLVGVGRFAPAPVTRDLSAGEEIFPPLDFAQDRVDALEEVFREYRAGGFEVTRLRDPDGHTLAAGVDELFTEQDLAARVVHVISHGRRSEFQCRYLEVMTSDNCGSRNNAYGWVQRAQEQTTPTLFLIDLCFAGQVTDLDLDREIGAAQRKAWVIGAARSHEQAFDGRFSLAVAQVLRACARDGLDVRGKPFVPFGEFSRRIADLVHRTGQHIVSTQVQAHEIEALANLPFLPNPRWRDDPVQRQISALNPALRSFLDDVVADLEHFRTRAGVHFTGRRAELRQLVPWLDGQGMGALKVVTGTAGAGKSALLGVLVCAAHPELRRIAPQVANSLAVRPRQNQLLVAIHSRQRRLREILESVADQLHLSWSDVERESWEGKKDQAMILIARIGAMSSPPVVVLDALDECPDFLAVQTVLLKPLATARRADGSPVCRLLVGVRPWSQFEPLMALARRSGGFIDLDQVDPDMLHEDLLAYVQVIVNETPFAARLAEGVAATLAQDFRRRRGQAAEQRWGQFLVASRYADYLVRHPARTESEAYALLANMPTDLPDMLELELSGSDDPAPLRATLAALAFAKGDGMPQEIADAVAAAFGADAHDVLTGEAARLYLRIATENDGTGLYRLYHQGLADYLRKHPHSREHEQHMERQVFDALVATRRDDRGRAWWESAPLYLRRHAIHHAVEASTVDELLHDPEFLVHAEPAMLVPELRHASTDDGRLAATAYRASYRLYRYHDTTWRRRLLLLNATRYQAHALASGLRRRDMVTDIEWATDAQLNRPIRDVLAGAGSRMTCAVINGQPVVVTGDHGRVTVWDLAGRRLHLRTGHSGSITAVACTVVNGQLVVVSGGADGTVCVWYTATGQQLHRRTGHSGSITAVAYTVVNGRPIAIIGSSEDHIAIVSGLPTGQQRHQLGGHTGKVCAVACTVVNGQPVAITGGDDGGAIVWNLTTGQQHQLTGHTGPIRAVACGVINGEPVIVTGGDDNTIRMWDPTTGGCLEVWPMWDDVRAVACSQDGRVVVAAGWDIAVFKLTRNGER